MRPSGALFYTIEVNTNEEKHFVNKYLHLYLLTPIDKICKSTCGRVITGTASVIIGICVYIASHFAGEYPSINGVCATKSTL